MTLTTQAPTAASPPEAPPAWDRRTSRPRGAEAVGPPAARDSRTVLREGLRGTRSAWIGLAVLSAVEALPALLSGRLVASALDRGFLAGRPLTGFALLAVMLVVALIGALATRHVVPRLARIVEPLRDHLLEGVVAGVLRRAVSGAGPDHDGGEAAAVARLTGQVEAVRLTCSALLRTARPVLSVLVGGIAGLALLSPFLWLIVIPPVVLALVLFGLVLRPLARRQRRAVLTEEAIAAQTAETLFGLRDVLACQAGEHAAAALGERIDDQVRAVRALGRASVQRILIVATGTEIPLVLLLVAGPWLIGSGRLSIGELAAAASVLLVSLGPALSALVQVAGGLCLQLLVTLGRLSEMTAPRSEPVVPDAPVRRRLPRSAEMSVRELTFAYGPGAEPVLADLTFDLADGEHLAVVGPSGGGKSTLVQLLAGVLVPQRGEVRLAGVPLADLHPRIRRAAITLVPQQAYLFRGSVADNLAYLTPFPDPAAMRASVRAVGAEELVEALGGYGATLVPSELSAGQRQLLALARAHLSRAQVCLLDEASCHLDPAVERHAEQAFLARGGTLVVVAHRLSSAIRADRVLLLDGAGTSIGTHEELRRTAPGYARLVGHWTSADRSPYPSG